jgi:hypothetical protein
MGRREVSLMEFVGAMTSSRAFRLRRAWIAVIGLHPWQLALFDERAQQEMG